MFGDTQNVDKDQRMQQLGHALAIQPQTTLLMEMLQQPPHQLQPPPPPPPPPRQQQQTLVSQGQASHPPEHPASINDDNNDLDHLRSIARKHIEEAVGMIPSQESQAYLEATKKVPSLFQKDAESDPLKFLRRCDYNHWDAAKRICRYWKERKALFGEDRAFRPMTLTGDGALDEKDIMCVKAGFPAFLPDTSDGKKVMYFDRRQWPPGIKDELRDKLRAVFYLWTVVSEDEKSQVDGVLILHLLTTPRLVPHTKKAIPKVYYAFDLAVHVIPIKFKILFLNFPPKCKKEYAVQDMIASFMGAAFDAGLGLGDQSEFLFEREAGDILKVLVEEYGLQVSGIPSIAGGSWKFLEAIDWCSKRERLESERYGVIRGQQAENGGHNNNPRAQILAGAPARTKTNTRKRKPPPAAVANQEPEDENQAKLTKRRTANVLHSRRKRERRRLEQEDMKNEHKKLLSQQQSLKTEHNRLLALLAQANLVVASLKT